MKGKIKAYLTSLGAWFFMPIGGPYTVHGIPDIIACLGGHFLAIEVKAPGKKSTTTPNQRRQIGNIADAGGHSLVADSVADVEAFLKERALI